MMFSALSNLRPSQQLEDICVWEKEELKSFQVPAQPELPAEDSIPEPENDQELMSQSSLMSHEPSYYTYLRFEDLHPCEVGQPDRNMHEYGRNILRSFLRHVSRRPRKLEGEVKKRRDVMENAPVGIWSIAVGGEDD